LAILREDPGQSQIKATRGWAVDLINRVSPVPIPADVRAELLAKKVEFARADKRTAVDPRTLPDPACSVFQPYPGDVSQVSPPKAQGFLAGQKAGWDVYCEKSGRRPATTGEEQTDR